MWDLGSKIREAIHRGGAQIQAQFSKFGIRGDDEVGISWNIVCQFNKLEIPTGNRRESLTPAWIISPGDILINPWDCWLEMVEYSPGKSGNFPFTSATRALTALVKAAL
jgi:hypothetical protein